jgi:hypothetical protein
VARSVGNKKSPLTRERTCPPGSGQGRRRLGGTAGADRIGPFFARKRRHTRRALNRAVPVLPGVPPRAASRGAGREVRLAFGAGNAGGGRLVKSVGRARYSTRTSGSLGRPVPPPVYIPSPSFYHTSQWTVRAPIRQSRGINRTPTPKALINRCGPLERNGNALDKSSVE